MSGRLPLPFVCSILRLAFAAFMLQIQACSFGPRPTRHPLPRKAAKIKMPSRCFKCDIIGMFSDPSGDPRIPESDLSLNVPAFGGSLDLVRIYDSEDYDQASLGKAWMHSFESRVHLRKAATLFLPTGGNFTAQGSGGSEGPVTVALSSSASIQASPDTIVELRAPDGRRLTYIRNSDGSFKTPVGETAVLTMTGSTTMPAGFAWTTLDKTAYAYDANGQVVDNHGSKRQRGNAPTRRLGHFDCRC